MERERCAFDGTSAKEENKNSSDAIAALVPVKGASIRRPLDDLRPLSNDSETAYNLSLTYYLRALTYMTGDSNLKRGEFRKRKG